MNQTIPSGAVANALSENPAQREQYHSSIDSEIERLDMAIVQANELLNRIIGVSGEECVPCPPRELVPLSVLLTDGASRINEKRNQLCDLLRQIEDRLF